MYLCYNTFVPDPMYLCYNTFFNTSVVKTLAMANDETGLKFQKHRCSQTLRKDVRELEGRRHMQDADITDGNTFPNWRSISTCFIR
jgi:hypothetical protein